MYKQRHVDATAARGPSAAAGPRGRHVEDEQPEAPVPDGLDDVDPDAAWERMQDEHEWPSWI